MFKNKFLYGVSWGTILPLITYPILLIFDSAMVGNDTVNSITGNSHIIWSGFKSSTLPIIAICINLIPTYFANRKRMDEFIRGIMFPTMVFSFIWFFVYKDNFL